MIRDTTRTMLSAGYWLFVAYLMIPLALMMMQSLNGANFIGFPMRGLTLQWYAEVIGDKQFLDAVLYSLMIAGATTLFASVIGVWTALLISTEGIWGKALLFALACLPAVVPGLINAISMRIFVRTLGVPTGTWAIIIAHTAHAVPFVVIMALTRLRSMPASMVEAAIDLGADRFVAFLRVTLPYLGPALMGGMVFCALTSIDDFVRTFFLGGYRPTLPMLIFARVQGGMSPAINAMATLVVIATALAGLWAERLTRRGGAR